MYNLVGISGDRPVPLLFVHIDLTAVLFLDEPVSFIYRSVKPVGVVNIPVKIDVHIPQVIKRHEPDILASVIQVSVIVAPLGGCRGGGIAVPA